MLKKRITAVYELGHHWCDATMRLASKTAVRVGEKMASNEFPVSGTESATQ